MVEGRVAPVLYALLFLEQGHFRVEEAVLWTYFSSLSSC